MRRDGRARGACLLVVALADANPITLRAFEVGHPEELLTAALAIGAVLAAARERTLLARRCSASRSVLYRVRNTAAPGGGARARAAAALRCVLDPWNTVCYEPPFVLALLAWEALCQPSRPPLLTLVARPSRPA